MILSEGVPSLLKMVREDRVQIQENQLETAVVQLHSGLYRDGLPGPYTKGQPAPFWVCTAAGNDAGRSQLTVYLPEEMEGFIRQDVFYDNSQSVEWNQENTPWYRISYTTNFHVVVSAEPAA